MSKTAAQQSDVSERAARFKSGDGLYALLVRLFGPPASCRGDSSSGEFGSDAWVEFQWRSGLSIKLEVQPIETSKVSVSNPAGLDQAAVLTEQLRDYARAKGLSIDWSRSTSIAEGALTIREYQDPEPGLNGIARLSYSRDGRLVALSLSVAP